MFFGLASHASAATGDITAVRVLGDTCTAGSSCNGWVAEIDITDLSTGGTYNFGLGANNDPTNAKIVFTVTSPGYDTNGNATTITRTIYGTQWLRKPYPNQATADEISADGTLTVRVSLSDFIYSGDTSITTNIGAGFYTGSNAATGISVTNNSTLAHPKVIANWSWPGWTKVTGSSFTVRAVAFHRSAMNGKPVAAVKFTATDQHSHSTTVTVSSPTIDGTMSDYGKVIEYIGTIPTTSFTANDLITVNFTAYPWVGDSGAVLNTGDGTNSQPTPLYAPIYFIYDGGSYPTGAAVVASTGNDSTCVAVAESAFNGTSDAATLAPCLTINKAAALINAYNNSQGRNDAAGTIYLQAGNYNWTGASTAISATVSNVWLTITPFPGVAKANAVINGQSGGQAFGGTKVKLLNVTVNVATNPVSVFNGVTYLWFDQSSLVSNGTAPIYQVPIYYVTRSSVGAVSNGFIGFGGVNSSPALIRGNDLTGMVTRIAVYTVLGNTNTAINSNIFSNEYSGQQVASVMPIFAFNTLYRESPNAWPVLGLHSTTANVIGAAVVQNIFENNFTNSTQGMIGIANDGSTATPVNNVLLWHNTIVGGRINRGYNDSGSTARVRTLWSEVGDLRDLDAIKTDTFGTPDANRTGNWAVLYGVGKKGSYTAEVQGGTTGFTATGGFQPEFDGLNSYAPTKTGANPINSQTNVVGVISYVNRSAFDGTNGNAGSGDYHLTASSPAINLIPSGQAVLPFDIVGNARHNNGFGAAGAYEWDVVAPTVTAFTIPSTATSLTVSISSYTASDAVGVTGYKLTETNVAPAYDAAGWTGSAPTEYTFASAGAKTLYAWAKDAVGNVSTSMSDTVTINLDAVAPTTSASPDGGTYGATQSVTLTCTDNDGGMGCDTIYYTTNGTDPTTGSTAYTVPISIPVNTTLKFFSVDLNSNEEVFQTETYIIDTTGPAIAPYTPANSLITIQRAPTFTWEGSDNTSGIADYALYLDNANVQSDTTTTYTPASLSCGAHSWYVKATDVVGNSTDSTTFNLTVSCPSGGSSSVGSGSLGSNPAIASVGLPKTTMTTVAAVTPSPTPSPSPSVSPTPASQTSKTATASFNQPILIRYTNSPKVYLIENNQQRWITDEKVFTINGFKWSGIRVINANDAKTVQYVNGENVTGKISSSAKATEDKEAMAGKQNLKLKTYLKQGSKGSEVKILQTILKQLGFFDYPEITGYFGPVTRAALIKFQLKYGLKPAAGFIGPQTLKKLNGE